MRLLTSKLLLLPMTVDIIILSHAKTPELQQLTQNTVDSCNASETDIKFNILVLEQQDGVVYKDCTTGFIKGEFNYNAFMNKGISLTSHEYVCLCNNDLIFEKGWCSNIIASMKKHNLLSSCPTQKEFQAIEYGYNNGHHMNGWCIMTNRKLYDIIGDIDTEFPFWFADNAYAEQLKKHNVKHAVVGYSVVKHLGSSTLKTLDENKHHEYTKGLIEKFIQKHPNNESAIYFKKALHS